MTVVGASADSVDIVVFGVGSHGAYPQKGVDPVLVAAQIVVTLQSIVSRTINPLEPGVITVGAIHGGTKHNIIGERVEMQLTVRADSFETRKLLLDSIDRVAEGGCPFARRSGGSAAGSDTLKNRDNATDIE